MMRYLSYPVMTRMPAYGQTSVNVEVLPVKSIKRGDSCNVFRFAMENHWGTHLDCPHHFFENGFKVSDYPPETWFFKQPFVLKLELEGNQLVLPSDMEPVADGSDLVLIQSGYYRFRGTDTYSKNNPGISPEVGEWLRLHRPTIRAVGFDFVSLSPYQNRELGRKTHQAFLNPEGINAPILIIEDMDLSGDLRGLSSVWVVPFQIDKLDSAPCTVIGIFE